MFLVSHILNALAAVGGPKMQHKLEIRRALRWGQGEAEWQVLDHLVDPKRAAVDIGANVGIYAGRLAQLCPKVHAFEPLPWLADDLLRKLPESVTIHRLALSDHAGTANLRVPIRSGIEENGLTTMEAQNGLGQNDEIRQVPCEVTRLDDLDLGPIGFIKIDVEGHEISVLQGAAETIKRDRPVLLIESQKDHNPAAPQNVFRFLRDLGYSILYLRDGRPCRIAEHVPSDAVNYIFLPPDDHRASVFGGQVVADSPMTVDLEQNGHIAAQSFSPLEGSSGRF